jgi:chromosome segregation ATPase
LAKRLILDLVGKAKPGASMTESDLTVTSNADVAIADPQKTSANARIGSLNSMVMARGEKIKRLTESLAQSDGEIAALNAILTQQGEEIADARRELKKSKRNQALLSREIERLGTKVKILEQRIAAIYASKSWRITAPLRFVSKLMQSLPPKGGFKNCHAMARRAGGTVRVCAKSSDHREWR